MGYYQIITWRRWHIPTQDTWRKQQGLGFLNIKPKWHTFWDGDSGQWECTKGMDRTSLQILIFWRKTRNFEWYYKQAEQMQDQGHKPRYWHMFQWTI